MTQPSGPDPVETMDFDRMDAHLPLRQPDDDLVPLLRKASSDDLGILVECIHRDRNEELSSVPAFQAQNPRAGENIYDGDHRVYADDIAAEIQRYCGNTISNAFRGGKGVPYIEAVRDVADHLRVNYNPNAAVDRIEREILLKVLEKAYEKMSDGEKRELLMELGVSKASGIVPSLLPVGAIRNSLGKKGFVALVLSAIVASAIVKTLVKPTVIYATGLAASIVAPRATAMFLGPIGLALTAGWAAWSLYDLGGPAYRVLVPCVAHVSFLRQKYCTCQSCWEVQPPSANFCQTCGAEIEPVR